MHIEPRKALNKAFLKIKPNRSGIELFKSNLIQLLDSSKQNESEEFHKNLISDFLKNTYYSPNYFINTKGRNDLVIHTGKEAKTAVGVIIEAKSPSNKAEMISKSNLNSKALQELVLYFLRERITHKNLEIKHLVATNLNDWFIFDGQLFDKLFAQNKSFVKQFQEFEEGKLSGATTDFFYREIAKPYLETCLDKLDYTFFDLATYDKVLRNDDKSDDTKLIVLYKLLSPEHLLKLSFANDSNSLDKNFYHELLHLIGLTETKEGGKKLIDRAKDGNRKAGSLLENTINQLDSLDKISRLNNPKQFGDTYNERLFTVALELCITWVNRILFLKLLEAQLIAYHKGDKSYAFLHSGLIQDYDGLNALFFMVLARKPEERNARVKDLYAKVPYLNSSLFEPTDLEHHTLFINGLEDHVPLPYLSGTVIKDVSGKKKSGEEGALSYFFSFLEAYDFASEGSEDIQEDNKTLINASVLGLIFEKINGYKDGSFYTPSFITMYMCKETIRRAVTHKFNEVKGWDCTDFDGLYNNISDTQEANSIINSIKICDPAVGSGHFLVSALNEIISIKHDLKVLVDREGKRLKEYHVDIVNDELIVTDEDGLPFVYNPKSKESQRIQETLFHEKQTIIENCLFGVDINPNSVKICRLRLWIELLKNAYYVDNRQSSENRELETLPNIDINIKCGNSLISRFGLDADLKKALKQSKWNIESYKLAVATYRNAENKEQKREMEQLITDIKGNFRSEIGINDPKKIKLEKLKGELFNYTQQVGLFERNKKEQTEWNKKVNTLSVDVKKLETEIEEIKSNKIYENAFEWRFEFPEVLNDQGDFVGFDVVIGNPPYISHDKINYREYLKSNYKCFEAFADLYCYFFEKGISISSSRGYLNFITSNSFLKAEYGKPLRDFFNEFGQFVQLINIEDAQIFEDAIVNTVIANFAKGRNDIKSQIVNQKYNIQTNFIHFIQDHSFNYIHDDFKIRSWNLAKPEQINLGRKISKSGKSLEKLGTKIRLGIATGSNEAFVIDKETADSIITKDPNSIDLIKPLLRGKDINRYSYHQEKYILLTKNGIDVEKNYPAIYKYLESFGENFKNRGAKGIHWTNLRACSFFEDFKESKIIWIELTDTNKFAICNEEIYLLNSAYFLLPPKELEINFLTGLLYSKTIKFYLKLIANTSGVGTTRWINIYVKEFPIARNEKLETKITNLVQQINLLKKDNPTADTSALEREIDWMVYELYGLSEEEIGIVENS